MMTRPCVLEREREREGEKDDIMVLYDGARERGCICHDAQQPVRCKNIEACMCERERERESTAVPCV